MGIEIERKFLVADDGWQPGTSPKRICQGYLSYGPPASVRVRISGDTANLNIKESTLEIQRREFEYPIPVADAEILLAELSQNALVEKTRYHVEISDLLWEVDVFEGTNEGLVLAEVELPSVDAEVPLPEWVGEEVSGDARYLNSNLARHPFSTW